MGLPRVQELFEARIPKGQAILSDIGGRVEIKYEGEQRWVIVTSAVVKRLVHRLPEGAEVFVQEGDTVQEGQLLARSGDDEFMARPKAREC